MFRAVYALLAKVIHWVRLRWGRFVCSTETGMAVNAGVNPARRAEELPALSAVRLCFYSFMVCARIHFLTPTTRIHRPFLRLCRCNLSFQFRKKD